MSSILSFMSPEILGFAVLVALLAGVERGAVHSVNLPQQRLALIGREFQRGHGGYQFVVDDVAERELAAGAVRVDDMIAARYGLDLGLSALAHAGSGGILKVLVDMFDALQESG